MCPILKLWYFYPSGKSKVTSENNSPRSAKIIVQRLKLMELWWLPTNGRASLWWWCVASKLFLSANSINIARLIPQSFYYFYALGSRSWRDQTNVVAKIIPSGELGNRFDRLVGKARFGFTNSTFIIAASQMMSLFRSVPTTYQNSYDPEPSHRDHRRCCGSVWQPQQLCTHVWICPTQQWLEQIKRYNGGYTFSGWWKRRHKCALFQEAIAIFLDPHGSSRPFEWRRNIWPLKHFKNGLFGRDPLSSRKV